mgnify:CR=1 FL=1
MERSNAHIASFVVSELQILRDLALCVYAEDQLPGMFANEKAYEEAEETLFRDLVTGSDFVSQSGAFSNSIRRTKTQVQLFLAKNPSNEELIHLTERFSLNYLIGQAEAQQKREYNLRACILGLPETPKPKSRAP